MKHIRHFDNLRYSVIATVENNPFGNEPTEVQFRIYEIFPWDDAGNRQWKKCVDGSYDGVDVITDADAYAHGEVKWNGCSNWHIDEQDRVMLHECDRAGLENIGKILAACWDWTKELLPNFYQ